MQQTIPTRSATVSGWRLYENLSTRTTRDDDDVNDGDDDVQQTEQPHTHTHTYTRTVWMIKHASE